jgi:hypothetical protein
MKSILQCGTLLAIAAEAAASPHILGKIISEEADQN